MGKIAPESFSVYTMFIIKLKYYIRVCWSMIKYYTIYFLRMKTLKDWRIENQRDFYLIGLQNLCGMRDCYK